MLEDAAILAHMPAQHRLAVILVPDPENVMMGRETTRMASRSSGPVGVGASPWAESQRRRASRFEMRNRRVIEGASRTGPGEKAWMPA